MIILLFIGAETTGRKTEILTKDDRTRERPVVLTCRPEGRDIHLATPDKILLLTANGFRK